MSRRCAEKDAEMAAEEAARGEGEEFIQDPIKEVNHLRFELGQEKARIDRLQEQVEQLNIAVVKLFNRGGA
jgi:hypothetical protein